MSLIDDLVADNTVEQIEERVLSVMAAVGIAVTAFIIGSPSEQLFQIFAALMKWISDIIRDANRAQFLDTAADPGDFDSQTPAPGWLSAKGKSDYNTERIDNTFATGFVTLNNNNGGNQTHQIQPEQLTFQNPTSKKTYRNTYDPAIYIGVGRVLTLAPSDVVTIPVRAEEKGTASNSAPNAITTLVSSLQGVTVTNASPVLGTDRETRDKYIARCKRAAAATSPNGPAAAYEYIALNTNTDGTLGTPDDGKTKVNVTRVGVTKDSSNGIVNVYLASPSGAATSDDVTAVTTAINQWAVPDAVTVIVAAAQELNITVTANILAKPLPGLVAATVATAAQDAVTEFFATAPIGGFDGMFWKDKITGVAVQAHPAAYHCAANPPVGDLTIAANQVATLAIPSPFTAQLQ